MVESVDGTIPVNVRCLNDDGQEIVTTTIELTRDQTAAL